MRGYDTIGKFPIAVYKNGEIIKTISLNVYRQKGTGVPFVRFQKLWRRPQFKDGWFIVLQTGGSNDKV